MSYIEKEKLIKADIASIENRVRHAFNQGYDLGFKDGKASSRTSSTTKNDLGVDCISRQSVLDKIQRLMDAEQNNIDENGDYMNYARERVNAYEAIQFFVENDCLCPSVTPQEPKTGHWIDINGIYAECSNCNEEIYITGDFKFCPNCGAKMVEPQKSEE